MLQCCSTAVLPFTYISSPFPCPFPFSTSFHQFQENKYNYFQSGRAFSSRRGGPGPAPKNKGIGWQLEFRVEKEKQNRGTFKLAGKKTHRTDRHFQKQGKGAAARGLEKVRGSHPYSIKPTSTHTHTNTHQPTHQQQHRALSNTRKEDRLERGIERA